MMKILLAEDDARLRKNIFHIISKEYHHVEIVDTAKMQLTMPFLLNTTLLF